MIFEPGSKIVFMGDSVTDCGRTRAVGGGANPLGGGWVNAAAGLAGAAYPALRLRFVNMGVAGDSIRDLEARWERDVMRQKPDWVVVMIGINEIWSQFDLPLHPEYHIHEAEYRSILERLVRVTLPVVKGMVLMAPYYLDADENEPVRTMAGRYGAAVRETAHRSGAVFVDTQAAMEGLLKNYHSSYISWDRVHPNIIGHAAIARAFLKAVGFEWNEK